MSTRREILQRLAVGVFAFALVLASAVLFVVLHQDDGIKKARFSLQDQDENTRSAQEFQGQWLLVSFGFTNCPHICPTQLMMITQALNQLNTTDELPTPVFITVDPERDTPAQLKRYLRSFHKDYIGLTGSKNQIDSAVNAFKVFYEINSTTQQSPTQVDHSSLIYLVDPSGNIVRHFPSEMAANELAGKLRIEI